MITYSMKRLSKRSEPALYCQQTSSCVIQTEFRFLLIHVSCFITAVRIHLYINQIYIKFSSSYFANVPPLHHTIDRLAHSLGKVHIHTRDNSFILPLFFSHLRAPIHHAYLSSTLHQCLNQRNRHLPPRVQLRLATTQIRNM